MTDGANSLADVMRSSRTGSDHVDARPVNAIANGEVAGGNVANHGGDEQRAHALGTLVVQGLEPLLQLVDTADARTKRNGHARGIDIVHGQSRLGHGFVSCDHGVLDEALEAARLLLGKTVLGSVEATYLTGVMHLIFRCVETFDRRDAALLAHDGIPQRIHANTCRRNGTHARDDDTLRTVRTTKVHVLVCRAHRESPPSMLITWPVI